MLVVVFVDRGAYAGSSTRPTSPAGRWPSSAAVGILVNLAAAALLARADRRSLNIAGAFWHIVTDLFAFVATLVAGLVIFSTGWTQADAVATLVVAALMAARGVPAAARQLRGSSSRRPRAGWTRGRSRTAIRGVDGVADVHELHVWEVTSGFPALSAHVLVDTARTATSAAQTIERLLGEEFGIEHTTLQVDHRGTCCRRQTSAGGSIRTRATSDEPAR